MRTKTYKTNSIFFKSLLTGHLSSKALLYYLSTKDIILNPIEKKSEIFFFYNLEFWKKKSGKKTIIIKKITLNIAKNNNTKMSQKCLKVKNNDTKLYIRVSVKTNVR